MILALLVTTLGFATLILVQKATSPPLVYGAYYAGTLFALYLGVRLLLPHSDVLLLPIVTLLTGLGLVMIFRLTYNVEGAQELALTQAVWILIGSGAMFLLVLFFRNYDRIFDYKYLLAIAAVFLIASTFTPLGYTVNGARLWVDLGPVNFQPSEFARIALVIFFAGYLAEKRDVMAATSRSFLGIQLPAIKYFGPVALVWAASLGLLVFEKDLGSSLLFFAVPLLMLYAATGRTAYVLLGGVLFSLGSFVTFLLFDHVQLRVQSWLDPWRDPDGTGFQILQSIFNIADGGLLGTGLGAGFAQTIPEVETDFVFSAIASELGLLGATAVLLAFLAFTYRGVTKAIPLTGITLPFVSYGGSSVVGNFILTGLLLLVSERAGRREAEGLAYRDDPWGAP
jgi:cell division protein FtsW (lipid II flippase)